MIIGQTTAKPNARLHLRMNSNRDIDDYAVFLKRFSDEGSVTVKAWRRAEVEGRGVTHTLDAASGFQVIVQQTVRKNGSPMMSAELTIDDVKMFDGPFQALDPDLRWSIVMTRPA